MTILDRVNAEIAKAKIKSKVWLAARQYIESHVGQKISKRIETHIKKQFPEMRFSYAVEYGFRRLTFWGCGVELDERVRVFLGYKFDQSHYTILLSNDIGQTIFHNNNWIARAEANKHRIPELAAQLRDKLAEIATVNNTIEDAGLGSFITQETV